MRSTVTDASQSAGRAIPYSILLPRYRHCGCISQSLRWRVLDLRTGQAKVADMIYGPKTDRILAGVLTVASGGWLVLILLGYLVSLGWGHVLGLLALFGIGVASLLTGKRRT